MPSEHAPYVEVAVTLLQYDLYRSMFGEGVTAVTERNSKQRWFRMCAVHVFGNFSTCRLPMRFCPCSTIQTLLSTFGTWIGIVIVA